jgi:hypothetical protein
MDIEPTRQTTTERQTLAIYLTWRKDMRDSSLKVVVA